MAAPIAASCLSPPQAPPWTLARAPLLARVAEAPAVALIAPAGYGKTTLLAAAFEAAQAAGERAIWLTLAPEWTSCEAVLAALEIASGASEPDAGDWPGRLAALLNAWASSGAPPQLFLDGLDALPLPARAPLRALSEAGPRFVRWRMAGRVGMGLDLQKLSLYGALLRLGPDALAFDPGELERSGFDRQEAERLCAATGGWPVAVALARAEGDSGSREDLSQASLRQLADYCEEQIFARLPEDLTGALMDLGVLARFTAESAGDVCGRADMGRVLDRLSEGGLFLEPDTGDGLDDGLGDGPGDGPARGEALRLQPLFARLARGRLLRRDPARVRALHRAAAARALAANRLHEAVAHGETEGSPEFLAEIVERVGGWRLGLLGGPKAFPAEGLGGPADARFPQLALGQIYFLAQSGRVRPARRAFEGLRRSTAGFRRLADAEKVRTFATYARTLDVTLRLYEDRPVRPGDEAMLAALRRFGPEADGPLAASAASLLALCRINLGHYEDAVECAEAGLERLGEEGGDLIGYFLHLKLGAAAIAVGRLDKAALRLERAEALGEALYGAGTSEVSAARILRAGAHYEADETAMASTLFEDALEPLAPVNGWFELYAEGFSAAAALAAITGAGGRLAQVLSECRLVARKRGLVRLARLADILEVREWVRSGEPEAALARAETPGFQALLNAARPVSPWRRRLVVPAVVEWARTLAALGRYAEAHKALARLDPARFGDLRQRLTVHAIGAGVRFRLGKRAEAAKHLEAALNVAARAGFVRRLRNHRRELWEAFDWARGQGRGLAPAALALGEEYLGAEEAAGPGGLDRRTPAAGPVYPLSPREMNVLELLSDGCSTKEIARRLAIAEGTVKTHRKKIYEKLGANSRSSALARARASQLL